MDEQWSFVGATKKPRWLFYAYDRVKRKVLCHIFGHHDWFACNNIPVDSSIAHIIIKREFKYVVKLLLTKF